MKIIWLYFYSESKHLSNRSGEHYESGVWEIDRQHDHTLAMTTDTTGWLWRKGQPLPWLFYIHYSTLGKCSPVAHLSSLKYWDYSLPCDVPKEHRWKWLFIISGGFTPHSEPKWEHDLWITVHCQTPSEGTLYNDFSDQQCRRLQQQERASRVHMSQYIRLWFTFFFENKVGFSSLWNVWNVVSKKERTAALNRYTEQLLSSLCMKEKIL